MTVLTFIGYAAAIVIFGPLIVAMIAYCIAMVVLFFVGKRIVTDVMRKVEQAKKEGRL